MQADTCTPSMICIQYTSWCSADEHARRQAREQAHAHKLVALLRHLLTANENLNVSVLSRGSEDKTHHVKPSRQKMYSVSTNTNSHPELSVSGGDTHKGIDERRKKPFLNDTSHSPDFQK